MDDPRIWKMPPTPASHVLSVRGSGGLEWFRNDPAGKLWVTADHRQISWDDLVFRYGPLTAVKIREHHE